MIRVDCIWMSTAQCDMRSDSSPSFSRNRSKEHKTVSIYVASLYCEIKSLPYRTVHRNLAPAYREAPATVASYAGRPPR